MSRVFVSYRHVEPDETVARAFAKALGESGHAVFMDTQIPLGSEWGEVIETNLREADCLLAIVSADAAASPMVVTEIEAAHRLNVETGRPTIIPLRLGEGLRLRYPLSAYVNRFQHATWQTPADTVALIERVKEALAAPPRPRRVASQRLAMIQRVRGDWIKGVLEKSLHHTARLDLGLTVDQASVVRGLDVLVQRPEEESLPVALGTPLAKVFDDHQGQLLILGAPGSGKTTLLLELARELLERAEHDEEHPIPVVFNLSSWAQDRPPLHEWMISELNLRSDAPKKLAREWVTNEQILPLLDGLDEVAAAHRDACVAALNQYRSEHGWVPLVVCSRKAEYDALSERLSLPAAIVVQPLERAQIERYLHGAGEALRGVRAALQSDPLLWDLLDTPLMLSVVALAYRDTTHAAPQSGVHDVFGRYVESMFRRRSKLTRYPEPEMRAWLQWLARNLVRRGQTVFFLEDVVPEWLLGRHTMWAATALTIGVAALLSAVWMWLVTGALELLTEDSLFGDFRWAWAAFSVPLAILLGVMHGRRAGPVDAMRLTFPGWRPLAAAGVRGAVFGFLAGSTLGYAACLAVEPEYADLGFAINMGTLGTVTLTVIFVARTLVTARMSGERRAPGALVRRSALSAAVSLAGAVLMSAPFVFYDLSYTIGIVSSGLQLLSWAGVFIALERGGYFVIRHYLARLILWRRRAGPWHYTAFLDAAAERILLRKVGGGYIFIHRMLMEYLAGATRSAWETRAPAHTSTG